MDRRASLAVVGAIAIGSAGIGWVAGQRIQSPADAAAEAQAPEPSLITVPVEEVALSSNVVVRGQVEFAESTDVSVTAGADGVAIVTRLPKAEGDNVNEGDVLIEVAGRPLFALQGDLPAFRSFTPGLEGPDVLQLEQALVRAGLNPGVVDEQYDADTEAAVSALYRNAGYDADEPSVEELERIDQARSSLRQAEASLREVQASGGDGMPRSQQLQLEAQVTETQEAYNEAIRSRDAAVAEARTLRDAAIRDGASAEELATAEANLVAVTAEGESGVTAASLNLEIMYAQRDEAYAAANEGVSSAQITQSREAVTEASTNLARLQEEIGIGFPAGELIFLRSLPSQIQTIWTEVGGIPQGAALTITGSGLQITSSIATADRSLINEGDEALMEDETLGISIPLTVAFIADNPGGQNASNDRYFVRFEPLEEVPDEALDRNLRVTLPYASTDGEVLAVPMAALSAGADGSARVEVERADGTVETVEVVAGLNARAQGLVEITPVNGDLAKGDRVIVGRDLSLASTGEDSTGEDETDTTTEEESDG